MEEILYDRGELEVAFLRVEMKIFDIRRDCDAIQRHYSDELSGSTEELFYKAKFALEDMIHYLSSAKKLNMA